MSSKALSNCKLTTWLYHFRQYYMPFLSHFKLFQSMYTYPASKKKRKASVADAHIHSKHLKKEQQQSKQSITKSNIPSSVRPVSPSIDNSNTSTTNYSR